jgi:hypothetical protein
MSAADNYERENLREAAAQRRAAHATVTVAFAITIGIAAILCAVVASLTVSAYYEQTNRSTKCATNTTQVISSPRAS